MKQKLFNTITYYATIINLNEKTAYGKIHKRSKQSINQILELLKNKNIEKIIIKPSKEVK